MKLVILLLGCLAAIDQANASGCLIMTNEERGGLSAEYATIKNVCNKKIAFAYCIDGPSNSGCSKGIISTDVVSAGGSTAVSVYDAGENYSIITAECLAIGGKIIMPSNVRFNGSALVADCK